MQRQRETPGETQEMLFGLTTVHDWLDKARRERERFLSETDVTAKTDHALNLAITLSHIRDWVHRLHIEGNERDWPNHQRKESWNAWVLEECPAMLILADLGNAAKHRILHKRDSNTKAAELGGVNYVLENLAIADDFLARIKSFSKILSVRTHIEDDEIAYLDIKTEAHKFVGPEGFRLFIGICNEAIAFWDEFLAEH